jgi:hypothetical protein
MKRNRPGKNEASRGTFSYCWPFPDQQAEHRPARGVDAPENR